MTAVGVYGLVAAIILGVANHYVDLNALVAPFGFKADDLLGGTTILVGLVAGYVVRERAHPAP